MTRGPSLLPPISTLFFQVFAVEPLIVMAFIFERKSSSADGEAIPVLAALGPKEMSVQVNGNGVAFLVPPLSKVKFRGTKRWGNRNAEGL